MEVITVLMYMAPCCFISVYLCRCHGGHSGPCQQAWWHWSSGIVNPHPWGFILSQWLSNLPKAQGQHHWSGSRSLWARVSFYLPYWLREALGGAELEPSLWPHCSSIRWWQAILQMELQAWWYCLRSPMVGGACPTEATGWDGWILVQLGYSQSLALHIIGCL